MQSSNVSKDVGFEIRSFGFRACCSFVLRAFPSRQGNSKRESSIIKKLRKPIVPALTRVSCLQNGFSLALWKGADCDTRLEKDVTKRGKAMQA